MINAALILVVVTTGVASQYAEGVMPGVVRTRQDGKTSMNLPSTLPIVSGYVASMYCDDIGKTVYLRPSECEDCRFERFLIADCPGSKDVFLWMKRNGIPFELDRESVLRWGEKLDKDLIGKGIKIEVAMEIEAPMYE